MADRRPEADAREMVQRIAKEGRKFGIGAMIVSQRPSEIDDTILSQCGTFIALRLTKLYNVLEALREGRTLTEAERDMHDRGLVTLIREHHDAIDDLVAQAYGWPADLSDEDILTRLVTLNKERAKEEARGLIRYLRPEYQDPGYKAPVNETLDLGEAAPVLPDNVIAWPKALPDQVSAVQSILSGAPAPLAAQDIARSFKGKRTAACAAVHQSSASYSDHKSCGRETVSGAEDCDCNTPSSDRTIAFTPDVPRSMPRNIGYSETNSRTGPIRPEGRNSASAV